MDSDVSEGWLSVRWDKTGMTEKYRWGAEQAYDVEPVAGSLHLRGEVVVPCTGETELNNRTRGVFKECAKRDLSRSFEVPLRAITITHIARETEGPPGLSVGFTIEAPENDIIYQLEGRGRAMIESREVRMGSFIDALAEGDVEFAGSDCLWNACWVEAERVAVRGASVPQPRSPATPLRELTPVLEPPSPGLPVYEGQGHQPLPASPQYALPLRDLSAYHNISQTPPPLPLPLPPPQQQQPQPQQQQQQIVTTTTVSVSPHRSQHTSHTPLPPAALPQTAVHIPREVSLTPQAPQDHTVEVQCGDKLIHISLSGDMNRLSVGSLKKSLEPYTESTSFALEKDGALLHDSTTAADAGISYGTRLSVRSMGGAVGTVNVHSVTVGGTGMQRPSSPPRRALPRRVGASGGSEVHSTSVRTEYHSRNAAGRISPTRRGAPQTAPDQYTHQKMRALFS